MNRALTVLALLVNHVWAADPMDPIMWHIQGNGMSATEIEQVKATISANPSNLEARLKWLGWLSTRSFSSTHLHESEIQQVFWLIEHAPSLGKTTWSSLGAPISVSMGDIAAGAKAVALWKAHLEAEPGNTLFIAGAAANLRWIDPVFSRQLLERGMKLSPRDSEWPTELGLVHLLKARSHEPDVQYTEASLALTFYEKAIALMTDEDTRCGLLYDSAAESAWLVDRDDKAATWANLLLKRARAGEWWFNNALHHGHTMLGLIALDHHDIAEAKKQLALSADVGTSPQLGSFGPSLVLAAALLELGERDAVEEFLEAVPSFLSMNQDRFKDAVATIKGGGTPTEFKSALRKIPQKPKKI